MIHFSQALSQSTEDPSQAHQVHLGGEAIKPFINQNITRAAKRRGKTFWASNSRHFCCLCLQALSLQIKLPLSVVN